MAVFKDQVEGITSLSVSTTPTTTELSQFLNDGVIDVTNRWLAIKPVDADNFTRESSEQTSNGFNPGTSKIVSVIRESGTNNQWYPCNKQNINLQYLVTDVDSLHYASKYNPVYMISQNRNVHVFPAPSADGNDTFKVLYVNNSPEETDGSALDYNSTGIKWFPDDKVYLVVLYASIRTVQANLAAITMPSAPNSPAAPVFNIITISEDEVGGTTVGDITVGTSTTVSTVTLSSPSIHSLSAPTYTKPTMAARVSFEDFFNGSEDLNPFGDSDPGDFSLTCIMPDDPEISSVSYINASATDVSSPSVNVTPMASASTYTGAAPAYTKPTQTFDMAQFETFLETEEDSELAQIQLGRMQNELGQLESNIKNEVSEYQKELAVYQSAIQESVLECQNANKSDLQQAQNDLQTALQNGSKDTQLALQNAIKTMEGVIGDNQSKINNYQAQADGFSKESDTQVKEYQAKLARYTSEIQTAVAAWRETQSLDFQVYQGDIQNELNEFNKENANFQASIQEEMQNLQAAAARVSKQAEIEIAEVTKQADIDMQIAMKNSDIIMQKNLANTTNDLQAKVHNTAKDLEAQIQEYANILGKYSADINKYQMEVAEQGSEYEWLTSQYKNLKTEYDQAFSINQPEARQEQASRRRRK